MCRRKTCKFDVFLDCHSNSRHNDERNDQGESPALSPTNPFYNHEQDHTARMQLIMKLLSWVELFVWRHNLQHFSHICDGTYVTCPSKHRQGTNLFIRWFGHTATLVAFYDTQGIRRTHFRLKPPPPEGSWNSMIRIQVQEVYCYIWCIHTSCALNSRNNTAHTDYTFEIRCFGWPRETSSTRYRWHAHEWFR